MPHEMEQQEIQPSSGGLGAPECGWPNHGRPTAFRARVVSSPEWVRKTTLFITDHITPGGSRGPPVLPAFFEGLFRLAQALFPPALVAAYCEESSVEPLRRPARVVPGEASWRLCALL